MPPGNIDLDPARPDTTPQAESVYIVETIKPRHPIPVIVIAAHPVAKGPVLVAVQPLLAPYSTSFVSKYLWTKGKASLFFQPAAFKDGK